jgi:hypothetical protein
MKTRSIAALIIGLVAVLALGGSPAGAGTSLGPEILDIAGDANFVNGANFFWGLGEFDTSPASLGGADLRAIWFETHYDTFKDRDAQGKITTVRHVPTGLQVKFRTQEPPAPTFGPTLTFYVDVMIGNCLVDLAAHVPGPASSPLDADQSAEIYKYTGCVGGSGALSNPKFTVTISGNVVTAEFPFSVLPYSSTQIVLAKDVELRAPVDGNPGGVQPYLAWSSAALTFVDEAPPFAGKFRLGSDVPADIDCLATPGQSECTA